MEVLHASGVEPETFGPYRNERRTICTQYEFCAETAGITIVATSDPAAVIASSSQKQKNLKIIVDYIVYFGRLAL
jgi:hypothetical protein